MDDFEGRAGPATGHRRITELGQVCARAPLPDRQLHAGGVARRRSIQEGDPDRQPELLAADTGRRRRTWDAGECACVGSVQGEHSCFSNFQLFIVAESSLLVSSWFHFFPFFACFSPSRRQSTIDNRNLQQNYYFWNDTNENNVLRQFSAWVDAVIFVFSLENEASFNAIYAYYTKLSHYRNATEIPIILVGTQGQYAILCCVSLVSLSAMVNLLTDCCYCPYKAVGESPKKRHNNFWTYSLNFIGKTIF